MRDDVAGAVQVAADRLLDDDAREGARLVRIVDESDRFEVIDAGADQRRRHGEVVNAAAGNAELLIDRLDLGLELGVGASIVEAAGHEKKGTSEVGPVIVVERLAREASDAVLGAVANVLVGIAADVALGGQTEADHGEMRRQHAVDVEVVHGWQQLAPGQIAAGAEDDQLARLGQERLAHVRFEGMDVVAVVEHAFASLRG